MAKLTDLNSFDTTGLSADEVDGLLSILSQCAEDPFKAQRLLRLWATPDLHVLEIKKAPLSKNAQGRSANKEAVAWLNVQETRRVVIRMQVILLRAMPNATAVELGNLGMWASDLIQRLLHHRQFTKDPETAYVLEINRLKSLLHEIEIAAAQQYPPVDLATELAKWKF